MKTSLTHLDQWRIQEPHASAPGASHGAFQIPHPNKREVERYCTYFNVIASRGDEGPVDEWSGWDHVSAHVRFIKDGARYYRCPTWNEMCAIKEMFFEETEVAMQIHPAKGENINTHRYTLHLWRPINLQIPLPPKIFV